MDYFFFQISMYPLIAKRPTACMMDLGGGKRADNKLQAPQFRALSIPTSWSLTFVRSFTHANCQMMVDGHSSCGAGRCSDAHKVCPVVGAGTASKCHASLSHAARHLDLHPMLAASLAWVLAATWPSSAKAGPLPQKTNDSK